MKRDYKALLAAGNKAQLEKLTSNGFKKGFNDLQCEDLNSLYQNLISEVVELREEYNVAKYDFTKIRHEAADIANFAHMIILATDKELENIDLNAPSEG